MTPERIALMDRAAEQDPLLVLAYMEAWEPFKALKIDTHKMDECRQIMLEALASGVPVDEAKQWALVPLD